MKALRPVPASRAVREKIEEKHGIGFEEIGEVFRRAHLVLLGPMDWYGERRYSSFGQSGAGRYVLVVYTVPEPGMAKVITAREMTDRERGYFRKRFRGRSRR